MQDIAFFWTRCLEYTKNLEESNVSNQTRSGTGCF